MKRWLPSCYCHTCGRCTHVATWRFPHVYLSSCRNCIDCPNSDRVMRPWNGVRVSSLPPFVMGPWFLFRYAVGGILVYVGGAIIQPKMDYTPMKKNDEAA
jgi:hypothetical protein